MTGKDSFPTAQTGKVDDSSKPQGASKDDQTYEADKAFAAHKAQPGPAIPQSMPEQEGSKAERQAKAKELNK